MNQPEPKPMRVSEWNRPAAPAVPAGPAAAPEPPAAPPAAAEEETPGLPIDPFRLLGGVWQRRRWVVIGTVSGLLLGAAYAAVFTHTRYVASVQMIRRDVPSSFRAGEIGETYKPRTLSTATLIGLAGSDNVLSRVAAKAEPAVGLGLLRHSVEVKDVRGTDYVQLTLSGYDSIPATVALANLWAQEVVDYSREMQARESREIRQYLQQQIDSTERELKRINTSILDYSRREGLVDADRQIEAYLQSLGELDLRYETARLDHDAAGFKLANLETELARQSPAAEKLRAARTELEDARARYTDRNPIVLEKLERVRLLEQELAGATAAKDGDLSQYAGTFLGNTLYLQVVELRNQREALARQMQELDRLRDESRTRLAAIPEKQLGLAQLARTRQSLEGARSLLFSRLREAQLFEERSPGYYQVFSPAAPDAVDVRPKLIKLLAFALAGLIGGASAALCGAAGAELLDFRLRTGAEAARAWGAPLLASLPADRAEAAARIWLRWLGQRPSGGHVRAVLVPAPSASEDEFWALLVAEARRLLPGLVVVDCTAADAPPPPALAGLPRAELAALPALGAGPVLVNLSADRMPIEDARAAAARLRQAAAEGREVWCRLPGALHEPFTTLARAGLPPLVVVCAGSAPLAFWRDQASLLRGTIGPAAGLVVTGAVNWKDR